MGRELRMTPANWQHPKDEKGHFIPLLGWSFAEAMGGWIKDKEKWDSGNFPDYADDESRKLPWEEWGGAMPVEAEYMPTWTTNEATHFVMYEDTSEGTPISPPFATIEELARWLANTGASAFGGMTANYESWLATCKRGSSISAILNSATGKLVSGVEGGC